MLVLMKGGRGRGGEGDFELYNELEGLDCRRLSLDSRPQRELVPFSLFSTTRDMTWLRSVRNFRPPDSGPRSSSPLSPPLPPFLPRACMRFAVMGLRLGAVMIRAFFFLFFFHGK